MAKPMFFYAGVYDDASDADADYEAIKALHAGDAIGSYDSAIITKQADGKVKVTKTEKPTQHGAWIGLAAGAGVAVVFPFLLPGLTVAAMAGGRRRSRRMVRPPRPWDQPRRGEGDRRATRQGRRRAGRDRHRSRRRSDQRGGDAGQGQRP